MSDKNNIEDFFNHSLESFNEQPSEQVWHGIAQQLEASLPFWKTWKFWGWFSGALVLSIGLLTYQFYVNQKMNTLTSQNEILIEENTLLKDRLRQTTATLSLNTTPESDDNFSTKIQQSENKSTPETEKILFPQTRSRIEDTANTLHTSSIDKAERITQSIDIEVNRSSSKVEEVEEKEIATDTEQKRVFDENEIDTSIDKTSEKEEIIAQSNQTPFASSTKLADKDSKIAETDDEIEKTIIAEQEVAVHSNEATRSIKDQNNTSFLDQNSLAAKQVQENTAQTNQRIGSFGMLQPHKAYSFQPYSLNKYYQDSLYLAKIRATYFAANPVSETIKPLFTPSLRFTATGSAFSAISNTETSKSRGYNIGMGLQWQRFRYFGFTANVRYNQLSYSIPLTEDNQDRLSRFPFTEAITQTIETINVENHYLDLPIGIIWTIPAPKIKGSFYLNSGVAWQIYLPQKFAYTSSDNTSIGSVENRLYAYFGSIFINAGFEAKLSEKLRLQIGAWGEEGLVDYGFEDRETLNLGIYGALVFGR